MAELRFHINPETGKANICRAKRAENCRYFGQDHYDSREEAHAAYELSQQSELIQAPLSRGGASMLDGRGFLKEEFAKLAAPQDVYCPHCGRNPDYRQAAELINNEWANCECGEHYDLGDAKVELGPESNSYRFLQKEEVLKATWYHATDNENWLAEIKDHGDGVAFEAHMGTEAAAFDRALSEYASHQSWGGDFILYEVELDPSSSVADEILRDENNRTLGTERADVVRYMNLWEDMASISLAVKPEKVRIKSKRAVAKSEAHQRISLYNAPPMTEEEREEYYGD